MRNLALLFTGFLATLLAGCESSDTTVAATCGYDDGAGNITFLYARDFGDDAAAANAACVDRAPDGNADADADTDTDADTDSGGNSEVDCADYDGDGVCDGKEDPVMAIGGYLYGHISIIPSGPDDVFLFGYGFTGEDDWCADRHESEKVAIDGETWWRSYLVDYGDEYRVNFGMEDACIGDDFTYWAYLEGEARYDDFVWQNESDGRRSICATYDAHGDLVPGDCDSNDD